MRPPCASGKDPLAGSRAVLLDRGLLAKRIEEELNEGLRYWKLEQMLCTTISNDIQVKVEDVVQAMRLKSFGKPWPPWKGISHQMWVRLSWKCAFLMPNVIVVKLETIYGVEMVLMISIRTMFLFFGPTLFCPTCAFRSEVLPLSIPTQTTSVVFFFSFTLHAPRPKSTQNVPLKGSKERLFVICSPMERHLSHPCYRVHTKKNASIRIGQHNCINNHT